MAPEDVSAEMLAREREVEMGKEDIKSKPEAVRCVGRGRQPDEMLSS